MNVPSEENFAPQNPRRNPLSEQDQQGRAEREAEKRRQYVAGNRDRIREMNRRWRAEHLERARQLNRDSMRRAAAQRQRQTELRDRGRKRAKLWREVHPERVRDYQQRWVQQNRDKVREYYNQYYATHRDEVNARAAARRDENPERTKQASKEWAERHKERRAEVQRTRRSDPQTYQSELEANAAARRLKRSLSRAGLPPKRLQPTTAAERRTNERESDAYFSDPALPEHLRQFTVFAESLTDHMLKNGTRMREFAEAYVETRTRMGLPPMPVENIVYARAVDLVTERMRRFDLLTSRDVAAAVRSTKAEVHRKDRQREVEGLVKAVVAHVHRNSERFSVDAQMENQARTRRGLPRLPVESLVVQLAIHEVIERVPTSSITIDDARSAARQVRLRLAPPLQAIPGPVDGRIHRRPVV